VLQDFPGQECVFFSVDEIPNNASDAEAGQVMYTVEYLNSINCSGLPLAHLALKVVCPVMVLHNLNPTQGVCNGTQGIMTRMENRVLEV
jgi:ATP-dependent DNA helicase PIF1